MKASEKCYSLIRKFEGCYLTAYKCPSGVLTIGYGHTSGVKQGRTITKSQAEKYLKADIEKFEKVVTKYYRKYKWTQNEFDALVSFAFNVGNIDGLTNNGKRSKNVIANYITKYVHDNNGKILDGLVKRRNEEKNLFLSESYIVTAKSGLNVRESPNTNSKILTTLQYNSEVKKIDEWSYIDTDKVKGWVSSQYIKGV